ncbi:MAG TPA: XRE family transcriptional regulator [Alphaproteobacteria bacterium]|nr:XRE family transcriptional regulator [Alphaproteobacteria bacterium]
MTPLPRKDAKVGHYIRSLRRQRRMTIDALAKTTGLTKSYLSRVERGLKAPSIATILKIANALNAQVSHLFGEKLTDSFISITRRSERKRITPGPRSPDSAYEIIMHSDATRSMESFLIYPGCMTEGQEVAEHDGEEMMFVLCGRIEVMFPDKPIRLDAGDCIYLQAHLRHNIRKIGRGQSQVLIVVAKSPRPRRGGRA